MALRAVGEELTYFRERRRSDPNRSYRRHCSLICLPYSQKQRRMLLFQEIIKSGDRR